jgi:CheY-like chemotaxis protein
MSHEIRTPLNAILTLSESLEEGIYGPLADAQSETLQVISESGHHLLELINDILDLSKIEADKMDLQLSTVNITSTCQAAVRMIKQPALKKGVQIRSTIEPDIPPMTVDERRVKQILVNLLGNAVKFTPQGGEIGLDVHLKAEMKLIEFSVWDTGIGIAAEDFESLFNPFEQVDNSLSRQYGGTGLGLTLARRLVEMHGGSIGVESQPGEGSRFFFSLPVEVAPSKVTGELDLQDSVHFEIDQESPGVETAPRDQPAVHRNRQKPLLLIAEDNLINLKSMRDYLSANGFSIVSVENGSEVEAVAQKFRPDLILMDIHMPGTDGLRVTQRLRALSDFEAIPIIIVTALVMPGDREKCLAAGANDYFSKPINLKALVQKIQSILEAT